MGEPFLGVASGGGIDPSISDIGFETATVSKAPRKVKAEQFVAFVAFVPSKSQQGFKLPA